MFDYKELKKKKVAFLCVENACRSQIAEAIANKLCSKCNLEFLSGGTKPADRVNPMALKVLKEEGINWQGKPKSIYSEEFTNIDIIVTMGCEVECPVIP
ncbi:MAG: arsenate reductase ArsC, partial [Candidatus Caldatribacteriota bacterium]